eukprot:SAG31_NODE_49479_length_138_cov_20.641026_1_plen_32_part_01
MVQWFVDALQALSRDKRSWFLHRWRERKRLFD